MSRNILTPVGRLVAGNPFEGQDKDAEGKPLTVKNGPNAGQPRVDYYMGLAIPKTDPAWPALLAEIQAEARESFPTLFDAAGNCTRPDFAFKYVDGDSQQPNTKNVRPCDREGYPGHWVLSFSSGYAPECYDTDLNRILDPQAIKRGYYIRISGTVRGNGSAQRPGVFLNHSMVQLIGFGEEIKTGPDAAEVFGGAAPALPTGASPTPTAAGAQTPPPAAGVQAAPDFLNPPGAPAPAPAAPPAVRRQLTDGTQYTEAELTAAGWTLPQIQALPVVG